MASPTRQQGGGRVQDRRLVRDAIAEKFCLHKITTFDHFQDNLSVKDFMADVLACLAQRGEENQRTVHGQQHPIPQALGTRVLRRIDRE